MLTRKDASHLSGLFFRGKNISSAKELMCKNIMKADITMNLLQKIFSNAYIVILPILVWNLLLASKLPPAYSPELFNSKIPFFILVGENIFRFIIFFLPLFFRLNITSSSEKKGVFLFLLGVALYFSSWLMLIYAPNSGWSNSLLGFTAPAYTPILWLVGLSLISQPYYFKRRYSKWHYIVPSIAFCLFHVTHAVYVYNRTY